MAFSDDANAILPELCLFDFLIIHPKLFALSKRNELTSSVTSPEPMDRAISLLMISESDIAPSKFTPFHFG